LEELCWGRATTTRTKAIRGRLGEGSRERPHGDARTIRVHVDVGTPRPNVEDLRGPLVARDLTR
jgi:hypothetical protein